jgi:3-phenylpropionate/cinnamic acid dioxygenase small subunit
MMAIIIVLLVVSTVVVAAVLYRMMGKREETVFVGEREDILVWRDGRLKLRRRKIILPSRVVAHTNLYVFF